MSTNIEKFSSISSTENHTQQSASGEQYQRVVETHRALKSMRDSLGVIGEAGDKLIAYLQNGRKEELSPELKTVYDATLEIARKTDEIIAAHDRLYFLWVDGAETQEADRSLN